MLYVVNDWIKGYVCSRLPSRMSSSILMVTRTALRSVDYVSDFSVSIYPALDTVQLSQFKVARVFVDNMKARRVAKVIVIGPPTFRLLRVRL
jgi:hypothetical protein